MPIHRHLTLWFCASAQVLGAVLAIGCLMAVVYAILRKRPFVAALYLIFAAVWAGICVGGVVIIWKLAGTNPDVGYFNKTVWIGYFFPSVFFLPFIPEPLRRCKLRINRQKRSKMDTHKSRH